MEQEEYTKEEINWSYVEFVDNQDVLDLIEKVLLLTFGSLLCNILCLLPPTVPRVMNTFCVSQKPGGIIALLDEAWYAFLLLAMS